MKGPDPLRDLPPNARDAVVYLADRIREGFVGTVYIECNRGVRRVESEPAREVLTAEDLARYRGER